MPVGKWPSRELALKINELYMTKHGACIFLRTKLVTAMLVLSFCGVAFSQEKLSEPTLIAFKPGAVAPVLNSNSFLPQAPSSQHRFWDRKNKFLFSTVAAFSAADFTVTHANLASGGRELNPIVRPFAGSNAALATNFAGQSAGILAISYLFHRSGHHRLERMAPVANIAASAFAVSYGLAHR